MIAVQGTVDVPEEIVSHTEPTTPFAGPRMPSGTAHTLNLTPFKNTGNVKQSVHATVSNPVNCTASNPQFSLDGVNKLGPSVDLEPGQEALLMVVIETPAHAPGPDVDYSFEVDTTWGIV